MQSLIIMVLVLVEVALWQWRVAITVRGNSVGGALLGFVGAVVQVTAIAQVVQDVGDIVRVAAYACGVAIDQQSIARLEGDLRALAPEACWTVEHITASRGLLIPTVA